MLTFVARVSTFEWELILKRMIQDIDRIPCPPLLTLTPILEGGVWVVFQTNFALHLSPQQLRFSFIGVVGSAREFGISVPFSAV